jgi:hypothetical protein
LIHLLPLCSAYYSSATLDLDKQTNSANGALGRQDRHDSAGISAVTAAPRCQSSVRKSTLVPHRDQVVGVLKDLPLGRAARSGFLLGLLPGAGPPSCAC